MRSFAAPMAASQLAGLAGGVLAGEDRALMGVASIDHPHPDCVVYCDKLPPPGLTAGLVLTREAVPLPHVLLPDPKLGFLQILDALFPSVYEPGIHPTAVVDPSAQLGHGVSVGAHVFVGARCTIGAGTVLHPGVVLYPDTVVGQRCVLHAGVVLGADGFSYHPTPQGLRKVPQLGRVRIEDDVELGAHTCVDRAFLDETVVGRGAKIDNLVQVGHNVVIGPSTVIAAQAGLSGSASVGAGAQIGGQAGLAQHAHVGHGARVGAQAGVHGSVDDGASVLLSPQMPLARARRVAALLRRLPELFRRVEALEQGNPER